MRRDFFSLTSVALALVLSSCALQSSKTVSEDVFLLRPSTFSALSGWNTDTQAAALEALRKSCTVLVKKSPDEPVGAFAGKVGDWQPLCAELSLYLLSTDDEARQWFENNFIPYAVYGGKGDAEGRFGLFTGYYEPLLKGSLEKKAPYLTPLYARPADLLTADLGDFHQDLKGRKITARVEGDKIIPYFNRADIEQGALVPQKKEIVWVDSPVDAFFLHIQGSGQVMLENGKVLRVGYAAQNGHAYFAIGKALIDRGILTKENVSMQSIRQWLEENPDHAPEVMNLNASYVFFETQQGEGPKGAQGVALTPHRSLAVDRKKIPYGVPVWLQAKGVDDIPEIKKLLIAQDTGGAIKGSVRGDYFWGAGPAAAHYAGLMKSRGAYDILLPKTVVIPDDIEWTSARRSRPAYND